MKNQKTIITCAVTGGDDGLAKYEQVPKSPADIAKAVAEAADAGASIAHIHVREPESGKPSMRLELYRETVERIRALNSEVIINLTTGPGAKFIPGSERNSVDPRSNMCTPLERVKHIVELKPEICTLDMGSLNFYNGVLLNVSDHIHEIAAAAMSVNVKLELEIFDSGQLSLATRMFENGLVGKSPMMQLVLGAANSAPASAQMLATLSNLIPANVVWAAFGVGRWEFPVLAQSLLLGGHVRVGLEDNLYLEKGVYAPNNASLVEKGARIIRELGGEVASPRETREMLGLAA